MDNQQKLGETQEQQNHWIANRIENGNGECVKWVFNAARPGSVLPPVPHQKQYTSSVIMDVILNSEIYRSN